MLSGCILSTQYTLHHRSSENGKAPEGLEIPRRFYQNRLLIRDDLHLDKWKGEGKAEETA